MFSYQLLFSVVLFVATKKKNEIGGGFVFYCAYEEVVSPAHKFTMVSLLFHQY